MKVNDFDVKNISIASVINAAYNHDIDLIKEYRSLGVDVMAKDIEGCDVFQAACEVNCQEIALAALEWGATANSVNKVVLNLLEMKEGPLAVITDDELEHTNDEPLMTTFGMLKFLIAKCGLDVNHKDFGGSLFSLCEAGGHVESLKVMLEAEATV